MNNYDLIKMIGQGSYGDVNLVSRKADPKLYVMKVVRNATDQEGAEAMKEVQILQQLDHPNIVSLKECFHENRGRTLCIVMEYCESGDLLQQIEKARKRKQYISQSDILDWYVQLALALRHLHEEKHILHRDLKPANVFLTNKARVLKLGDFGITKVLENTRAQATTTIGTPYYFSPEICQNQPYGIKSDIWSFGCIVYELMTLAVPFEARSMAKLVQNILHQRPASPNTKYYSSDFLTLLAAMLAKGPSRRPTISQCLATPLVRSHLRGFTERFSYLYSPGTDSGLSAGNESRASSADSGVTRTSSIDSLTEKKERMAAQSRERGQRVLQSQAVKEAPIPTDQFSIEYEVGDNAAIPSCEGGPDEAGGLKPQLSEILEVTHELERTDQPENIAHGHAEPDPDLEKTCLALHHAVKDHEAKQHGADLMSTIMRELDREVVEEPLDEAHREEAYEGEIAGNDIAEPQQVVVAESKDPPATGEEAKENIDGSDQTASNVCSLM